MRLNLSTETFRQEGRPRPMRLGPSKAHIPHECCNLQMFSKILGEVECGFLMYTICLQWHGKGDLSFRLLFLNAVGWASLDLFLTTQRYSTGLITIGPAKSEQRLAGAIKPADLPCV